MAILEIARMGNPILLRRAAPVEDPTRPEIAALVADMLETMAAAGGVGLAAPQVSVSLQVIVYAVPAARTREDGAGEDGAGEDGAVAETVLINPVLEPLDAETESGVEGCLSAPGLMGPVPRWRRLRYRGLDLQGRLVEGEATGFHARVLQHECDHLLGRLYLSRMSDIAQLSFTDEIRRQCAAGPQPKEEVPA